MLDVNSKLFRSMIWYADNLFLCPCVSSILNLGLTRWCNAWKGHDNFSLFLYLSVKALNQARLEATIRMYGTQKIINKWPSPYILACGIFLLASVFQIFFRPLQWLAIAAVAVGLPPIVLRSIAAIRRYTLDINILMLIAGETVLEY